VSDSIRAVPAVGKAPPFDTARIERAVREILEAIGEDPDRDGLRYTPRRIAEMYEEIFSGLREDPRQHVTTTFEADHDEMVIVRDIPMYSACEHHLLPWVGRAHVAYIPNDDGRIKTATAKGPVSAAARSGDILAARLMMEAGIKPGAGATR